MRTHEISNNDDVIDSRDVIARIEELEGEREGLSDALEEAKAALQDAQEKLDGWEGADESEELLAERDAAIKTFDAARNDLDGWDEDNAEELKNLKALAEDAEGHAEDWRHGATLIRESYFTEYAQQLADDIGAIDRNASWPCDCIDWDEAADQLRQDYSEVQYGDVTYLVR